MPPESGGMGACGGERGGGLVDQVAASAQTVGVVRLGRPRDA